MSLFSRHVQLEGQNAGGDYGGPARSPVISTLLPTPAVQQTPAHASPCLERSPGDTLAQFYGLVRI